MPRSRGGWSAPRATRARATDRWENRLRSVRLAALCGSMAELERRSGVPQGQISKYERNSRLIPIHHALAIAEALEIPLGDLYARRDGTHGAT